MFKLETMRMRSMNWMRLLWALWLYVPVTVQAQELPAEAVRLDTGLIYDPLLQVELADLIDYTYNYDFAKAEKEWLWLHHRYRTHPLPYLVKGLIIWWKMMPNIDKYRYDEELLDALDKTIELAEERLKKEPGNPEYHFYLAAAYGYKGRLYAERESWVKAAWNGKQAIKYLRREKEITSLSVEFLFGDGLYNFYSIWIPENYPSLRPLLIFFEKGDKKKGIEQLEEVAKNAFYTRLEAYYFLMRIYALEENQPHKATQYAQYLYERYPNNPYFHRFYTMLLFLLGRIHEMEKPAQELLRRVENGQAGYEEISGRYATYFLAYKAQHYEYNMEKAIELYQKTIAYAEAVKAYDSGYYQSALQEVARWAESKKNYKLAKACYAKLAKYGDRGKRREARKKSRKLRKIEED
jgi:hypothetical protein